MFGSFRPRNLAVVPRSPITHPLSSQQQEEERLAQELEDNRGVSLHLQLSAAPADMASAAARGIKRAADKLLLPPSAGASLLNQSASRNGAMLFEVAASNGGRTHAGVLEVRGGVKGEQRNCRSERLAHGCWFEAVSDRASQQWCGWSTAVQ